MLTLKDSKLYKLPETGLFIELDNAILNWNVHLQYMVIVTVWLYLCKMDWLFSLSEPSCKPCKNHQTSRYHKPPPPPPPPVFTVRLPRRNGWENLILLPWDGRSNMCWRKSLRTNTQHRSWAEGHITPHPNLVPQGSPFTRTKNREKKRAGVL